MGDLGRNVYNKVNKTWGSRLGAPTALQGCQAHPLRVALSAYTVSLGLRFFLHITFPPVGCLLSLSNGLFTDLSQAFILSWLLEHQCFTRPIILLHI